MSSSGSIKLLDSVVCTRTLGPLVAPAALHYSPATSFTARQMVAALVNTLQMMTMTNPTVDTDALLSRLDHSKLPPGALDAMRAELAQLLEYAAQLRALPLDGVEPALGPQRWT